MHYKTVLGSIWSEASKSSELKLIQQKAKSKLLFEHFCFPSFLPSVLRKVLILNLLADQRLWEYPCETDTEIFTFLLPVRFLIINDLEMVCTWKPPCPWARAAVKSSITGLMLNVAAHSAHQHQPVARAKRWAHRPPLNKGCQPAIPTTRCPLDGEAEGWHRGGFYYRSISFLFKGCRKKRAVGKQWCIVGIFVCLSQWDGFIAQWEERERESRVLRT